MSLRHLNGQVARQISIHVDLSLNRRKFKETISLSKTDCSSCRTQLGKSVNASGDFGDENIKRVSDNDTVSVVPNKTAGGAEMDYWCCQWSGDTISVHMRHDVMAAEFLLLCRQLVVNFVDVGAQLFDLLSAHAFSPEIKIHSFIS